MVEIRQVRNDELDSMLECMAAAYGISKESWADGFYNGPYNDIRWKRVVVVDGKVVSCLVIIPREMYLAGTTVSMGGIAGVATLPDERRHGYAGALMVDSVRALRELGLATSGLYPFSYKYYRKFGWEFAGQWLRSYIKPEHLPAYSEACHMRPLEDADLPDLMRIYEEHFSGKCGPFVRSERHWQRHILPRAQEKLVYDDGAVQGYLFGNRGEEDGEDWYWANEVIASIEDARRGLVGFLAQRAGEVDKICIPSCAFNLDSLGLLSPRAHWEEGYDARGVINMDPSFQFRIIDLQAAMMSLVKRVEEFDGELTLVMEDEIGMWNNEPVTIRGREVIKSDGPNRLKADVRTLSQIYIGYLSPADALSQGKIEVSSAEALRLADQIFPESEPFVPYIDEY